MKQVMMPAMYSIARAMYEAGSFGVTWEAINRLYLKHYDSDHRYRVFFEAATNTSGLFRCGSYCFYAVKHTDAVYIKSYRGGLNHNLYDDAPCYRFTKDEAGICSLIYQSEVLI